MLLERPLKPFWSRNKSYVIKSAVTKKHVFFNIFPFLQNLNVLSNLTISAKHKCWTMFHLIFLLLFQFRSLAGLLSHNRAIGRQRFPGVKTLIQHCWHLMALLIRRLPPTAHLCHLFLFEGVSVTSTPPSACYRTGPSSASVNTTPLARTASAAGRASKPNPGKLVPTCQRPTGPPTAVRIWNVAVAKPVNKDGQRERCNQAAGKALFIFNLYE